MAQFTYSELIAQTLSRLSMVDGTGVQVYSEEKILNYFIGCRDQLLMDQEYPWDLSYNVMTLNGVDGKTTAPSEGVYGPTDLLAVYRAASDRPIPLLPRAINPARITGTTPMYLQFLPTPLDLLEDNGQRYLFKIWPITSTGDVTVVTKPYHFIAVDQPVTLDREALILWACAMHETSDAANPAQAQVFMSQYSAHINNIKKRGMDIPSMKNPRSVSYLQDWTDPDTEGYY